MNARAWLALAGVIVTTGGLLFVSAGTIRWAEAWWLLALYAVSGTAVMLWLAKNDPGLLAARMNVKAQEGQPVWDRMVLIAARVIYWSWLILMGLDGGRFDWSALPEWLIWVGRAAFLAGIWGIYRVFRENSFTAPVVRIQAERGHHVISTGPYAIIRHPMYTASLFMLVGWALALNSAWGVLGAIVIEFLIALRIGGEEKLLREGLPGYVDYTRKVRYRLIPFIW
jgi:protein-S-isoprenylcysteine O-methyltransferase Ste14